MPSVNRRRFRPCTDSVVAQVGILKSGARKNLLDRGRIEPRRRRCRLRCLRRDRSSSGGHLWGSLAVESFVKSLQMWRWDSEVGRSLHSMGGLNFMSRSLRNSSGHEMPDRWDSIPPLRPRGAGLPRQHVTTLTPLSGNAYGLYCGGKRSRELVDPTSIWNFQATTSISFSTISVKARLKTVLAHVKQSLNPPEPTTKGT